MTRHGFRTSTPIRNLSPRAARALERVAARAGDEALASQLKEQAMTRNELINAISEADTPFSMERLEGMNIDQLRHVAEAAGVTAADAGGEHNARRSTWDGGSGRDWSKDPRGDGIFRRKAPRTEAERENNRRMHRSKRIHEANRERAHAGDADRGGDGIFRRA